MSNTIEVPLCVWGPRGHRDLECNLLMDIANSIIITIRRHSIVCTYPIISTDNSRRLIHLLFVVVPHTIDYYSKTRFSLNSPKPTQSHRSLLHPPPSLLYPQTMVFIVRLCGGGGWNTRKHIIMLLCVVVDETSCWSSSSSTQVSWLVARCGW